MLLFWFSYVGGWRFVRLVCFSFSCLYYLLGLWIVGEFSVLGGALIVVCVVCSCVLDCGFYWFVSVWCLGDDLCLFSCCFIVLLFVLRVITLGISLGVFCSLCGFDWVWVFVCMTLGYVI